MNAYIITLAIIVLSALAGIAIGKFIAFGLGSDLDE